jgi:transposase
LRGLSGGPVLRFQINRLLERDAADTEAHKEREHPAAGSIMAQIELLTSMKGISVFIAIAIIADIIDVSRFRDSKAFTGWLRSAPEAVNSNTPVSIRGTNKQGRKLSATLLNQSPNHVLDFSLKLRGW